jgi:ATP-dependent exoDNAse (exonuclease V) beta subunit
MLWGCLDELPEGEQDLLGPALDAALDKLTALPDPNATGECGVQLMTIHKSKGLEFEIVIVPDLQARSGRTERKLLSWLERGLRPPTGDANELEATEEALEVTEFLVAPIQAKGDDRGTAKAWVDRVRCERESQEIRRILYVAATRSREELHLFARPSYKADNGELTLFEPSDCLLATAWPAFESQVRDRFEAWRLTQKSARDEGIAERELEIETLAAAAESNLLVFARSEVPAKPTILRRLPWDFADGFSPASGRIGGRSIDAASHSQSFSELDWGKKNERRVSASSATSLYSRHQGGQISRSLGIAVHFLLQQLARLRAGLDLPEALSALEQFQPAGEAQIRSAGIATGQADTIAAEALRLTIGAAKSPIGQWILANHPDGASEVRWTGVLAGTLRTVQIDRLFRAGLVPGSEDHDGWWLIDFKTAQAALAPDSNPAAALAQLRPLFAPQLEAYAQVFRNLHGAGAPLRVGLFYPRMLLFDWWEM